MSCPRCANPDIRRSRSSHWSDAWHRAWGRDAYRCRKCRLRFFQTCLAQTADQIKGQTDRSRKAGKRLDFRRRKRLIRRLIAITVFIVMFSMFGLFLRHISQDNPPPSSTQDSGGASDQ